MQVQYMEIIKKRCHLSSAISYAVVLSNWKQEITSLNGKDHKLTKTTEDAVNVGTFRLIIDTAHS